MTNNEDNRLLRLAKLTLAKRFNLHVDKADEADVISSIKKNSDFVGANLWTLIFAIFIAPIGLNVNPSRISSFDRYGFSGRVNRLAFKNRGQLMSSHPHCYLILLLLNTQFVRQ